MQIPEILLLILLIRLKQLVIIILFTFDTKGKETCGK